MVNDDLPAMETTREVKDLLTQIRPPPLEDAGLEDCALPPESIKQAFLKAASAVGSRPSFFFPAESDEESDAENVEDPKESSDQLFGIRDGIIQPLPSSGPCSEVVGDDVAVVGEELKKEEGNEVACVDGLKSLKIG